MYWVKKDQADFKVESRSKPGAYFYAHPATKRTQAEHPGERQGQTELNRAEHGDFRAPWSCRHISSKRPEGPRRRKTEGEAEEPGQLLKTVKTHQKKEDSSRKWHSQQDVRCQPSGCGRLWGNLRSLQASATYAVQKVWRFPTKFFELVQDLGIFEEQFIHQWWPQALASGPCW